MHEEEHEMYTICAKYEPCISIIWSHKTPEDCSKAVAITSSSPRHDDSPMEDMYDCGAVMPPASIG